mmetsp:Transcript_39748/g.55193  ORF Transcript_39748/g.55193 Transcript_39748/m.55193 type:complete len:156 (-) Transcript_39748:92-559(-)
MLSSHYLCSVSHSVSKREVLRANKIDRQQKLIIADKSTQVTRLPKRVPTKESRSHSQGSDCKPLTALRSVLPVVTISAALFLAASPALASSSANVNQIELYEHYFISLTPAFGYLYFKNVLLKNEPDKIFISPQVYTFLSLYSCLLIAVACVFWK